MSWPAFEMSAEKHLASLMCMLSKRDLQTCTRRIETFVRRSGRSCRFYETTGFLSFWVAAAIVFYSCPTSIQANPWGPANGCRNNPHLSRTDLANRLKVKPVYSDRLGSGGVAARISAR